MAVSIGKYRENAGIALSTKGESQKEGERPSGRGGKKAQK